MVTINNMGLLLKRPWAPHTTTEGQGGEAAVRRGNLALATANIGTVMGILPSYWLEVGDKSSRS